MKTLYLESIAGIAGDMFAAAFLDAGLVTEDEIREIPGLLGLDDVEIVVSHPLKAAIRATHLAVVARSEAWKGALGVTAEDAEVAEGGGHGHRHEEGHDLPSPPHRHDEHGFTHYHAGGGHWHTHYTDLDRLIAASRLDDGARMFARTVFRHLAEAEAAAHGMPVDEVAFHEVGAVDSIVDVAMAAFCVTRVDADRVLASPVKLGRGHVHIAHGTHAVPPPASARLVVGMPIDVVPEAIQRPNVELSTPTGLAILKALSPEFVAGWPAGTVRAQGMGAGTMDLGVYPNVFRVALVDQGSSERLASELPYETDTVIEIVCNIDDETAERMAWAAERLLEMGALDVWQVPATGKKGRAAVTLSVLATPDGFPGLADWILRHTSTFGIRYRTWDRLKLAREMETREGIAYKIGKTTAGEVLKEKPEFEDLRRRWDG